MGRLRAHQPFAGSLPALSSSPRRLTSARACSQSAAAAWMSSAAAIRSPGSTAASSVTSMWASSRGPSCVRRP